ncbi:hypothetical protein EVAR_45241_1 [Eumeta japonica]|uniref:Uncharacterized protein n=1 Tax=Eumeta variegata TaxID=151549 RepID=A0A4C1XDF3_EUMVA|nr:hypothetical protein EVAR_45241_1 [Eumeta japonica]
MNSGNLKGVTSALPASWEEIGYLIEGDHVDGRRRGGVGDRNLHSLNEKQQQKLLLHDRILLHKNNRASRRRTSVIGPSRTSAGARGGAPRNIYRAIIARPAVIV